MKQRCYESEKTSYRMEKKIAKHKSHLKNLVSRMYREVSQLNIKQKIWTNTLPKKIYKGE